MKILFLLSGTNSLDGSTKSFLNLLNYLECKNIEAHVVCPNRDGVYKILTNRNIPTYYIKYRFSTPPIARGIMNLVKYIPRLLLRNVFNATALSKLNKIVEIVAPDIIHSNSSVIKVGYDVARSFQIPHVFHIREYGDLDFNLNTSYITNLVKEGKSYSISITKDIARHKGIMGSPYNTVIYNGIVNSNKLRLNEKKEKYFLYAGRIEPTKGIADLVDAYIAYNKLANRKFKLLIAGGIPKAYLNYCEKLRDKIAQSNIAESVIWMGDVENLDEYFYNAAAVIVPSVNEGFGRVMVEAMANGCVCIARNTGGSKEQLDNGLQICKEEIAYRFSSIQELVQSMLMISEESTVPVKMIENSQRVIQTLYSQEKYGQQVLTLYKSIAEII